MQKVLQFERNLVVQSIYRSHSGDQFLPEVGLHMVEAKRFAAETDKIEAEIERKF